MQSPPVQSAGRRFLKRLGFALLQAVIFGFVLGGLMYFRVPRTQLEVEGVPQTLMARLAELIESPERLTYDARLRILGERLQRQRVREGTRQDRIVLVTVDDDSLANSRESEHPGLAAYPWSRELLGGITRRIVQEGASLVMIDSLFPELSPRTCSTQGLSAKDTPDDAAFRQLLDQVSGHTALGFSWAVPRSSPPASRLWPYRVRVGVHANPSQARAQAQGVLSLPRPVFLIPSGDSLEVWAGVEDPQDGQLISARFGPGPAVVQERRAADDTWRVSPLELFVSLTEVEVEGLDPSRLLQVRTLQHPVVPLLGPQSVYGAVNGFADPDGVHRGVLHLVSYTPREGEHHVLPSLSLAAAMKLAGTRKLRFSQGRLYVGELGSIPMEDTGFSLIRWESGDAGRTPGASVFRSLRAWNILVNLFDVLEDRPPRSDHDLEGRAVLLTNTSSYATDAKATPIGKSTPGGALHAQALANLLQSQGISRVPLRVDQALTVAMAFLGAAIALSFSRSFRSGFGAALYFSSGALAGLGYFAAVTYFFVRDQLWIAAAGPLLALAATFLFTTLYAVRTEREVRDFVNQALGRYVSPEVARLVTRDLTLLVRPERRQMSVYFSDIEGFTRLSEQMEPERLVQLLNEYLTEMTMAVRSTGGQVDKYIGDAIMAFWGAPVRTDRHAHLACEAALKMRAVLRERQPHWEKTYGHRIEFRAGINSGEVVVGDMGSELKSAYTVMGDAVNLASRLENANKGYGTYVLVGENTAQAARDAFVFREVDRVLVKGRTTPTRIHELLGRTGEIAPRVQEQLGVYEQALTAYHQRRFDEALALFERCASEFQDPVAAVYADRCRRFLISAPAEDWDGASKLGDR